MGNIESWPQTTMTTVTGWGDYTPVLVQGATTFGLTVVFSRYVRSGRTITCLGRANIASGTGVAGSALRLQLPFASAIDGSVGAPALGSGWIYDASATTSYPGVWNLVSTTLVDLMHNGSTNGAPWGNVPSVSATTSDIVSWNLTYEAAS